MLEYGEISFTEVDVCCYGEGYMNIEELVQEKLRLVFQDDTLVFDKSRFAGGLTNYNYIMEIHGKQYVVRQPGNMTSEMIDRKIERVNNGIASEFGVNSTCVFFDDVSGIKISEYIENSLNVSSADPNSPRNIQSVASLLHIIHRSPKYFPNRFDWLRELKKYEILTRQVGGAFFFDYDMLKDQFLNYMREQLHPTPLVPCHNDTVPENFIVDNHGRTYLVDWEYSGMNDPAWDIAAYVVESRLTKDAIDCLLQSYYTKGLSDEVHRNIQIHIIAQDLLWTVWALLRHYSGDDFLDYCDMRYARFRANVNKLVGGKSPLTLAEMVAV